MLFIYYFQDDLVKETHLYQQELITEMQQEIKELTSALVKQKTFTKLRSFQLAKENYKKMAEYTDETNKIKRKVIDSSFYAEEQKILLSQQKDALKKELILLDSEYNNLKLKLDKEVHYI